jgi:hypothetical protein
LRHKPDKAEAGAPPQPLALTENLTFLDVIRDSCARGGRFTATAQSPDGSAYTVLVDRGGPFNVSGGGLSGTDALIAASRLRAGTYTLAEGWPVAQPLYQIGLDATLRMLSSGTMPAVVGELPAARGIDALRNADAAVAPPRQPAAAPAPPADPHPVPFIPTLVPDNPQAERDSVEMAAAPEPTTVPEPAAAEVDPQPVAPVATVEPGPVVAIVEPVAVVQVVPEPPAAAVPAEPAPAEHALVESLVPPVAPVPVESSEANFFLPGGPTTSADQGGFRHLATQSLLWLVQIDEPERYTLPQARRITSRAITGSMSGMFHPFQDAAHTRWQKAKQDWEKSGEVVAKQQARKKKRVREVDVDPRQGPLSGR